MLGEPADQRSKGGKRAARTHDGSSAAKMRLAIEVGAAYFRLDLQAADAGTPF
jgi:hypothetical protein